MSKIVTLRLDEELVELIDEEADARGVTRSEYIRNLLANTHDYTRNQSANTSDYARLRKRVDELEAAVFDNRSGGGRDEDGAPDLDALVAGLDIPGDGDLEARRRTAVRELLAWARGQDGSFQRADVLKEWLTDEIRDAVGYANDNSRWQKLFQGTLSDCPGIAKEGRSWRWVGVDEDYTDRR